MRRALVGLLAAVWLAPMAVRAGEEAEKPPKPGAGQEAKEPGDAEKRIMEVLKTKKVTFDFVETPITDVANFIQALLGVNLILDPGVDKAMAVTLRVNEMPVGQALQWIAKLAGAKMDVRDGAVVIEPAKEGERAFGPDMKLDKGALKHRPPDRPFGKATLALGTGVTIELELSEGDLQPEVRQLLVFLLHRQIVAEAQKYDPKAVQEFMEGMAKRQRMEADMRARMEAEMRRRAEEEGHKKPEKRAKPEGGDEKKGQF